MQKNTVSGGPNPHTETLLLPLCHGHLATALPLTFTSPTGPFAEVLPPLLQGCLVLAPPPHIPPAAHSSLSPRPPPRASGSLMLAHGVSRL